MHKFSTARNRSSRCPRARARTRDGTPSGPGAFFLRRSLSLTMSNSSSDTGGTTAAAASGGASEGAILGGSNGPGSGNRVPITRSSSPLSIAEQPPASTSIPAPYRGRHASSAWLLGRRPPCRPRRAPPCRRHPQRCVRADRTTPAPSPPPPPLRGGVW
ncbi:hypothetical protein ACJJTC_009421 [Scirpophaga incertulas]